jgi:hypothetical protein
MSRSRGKRGRGAANGRGGNCVGGGELRSDLETNSQETSEPDDVTNVTLSLDELRSVVDVVVSKIIDSLKSELAQRLDDIDNQFLDLKCSISSKLEDVKKELCAKTDKIHQNHVTNNTTGPVKTFVKPIETAINEAMREKDERESKKKNIILFNVAESKSKVIQNRVEHDVANVKELVDILEINPDIKNMIRLGKADDSKVRPILLKLESEGQKEQFLSNAKKLGKLNHDDIRKKIVIKKDLTKFELEQERTLVRELKERRQKGEELFIRNGRIVQRNASN